MLCSPYTPYSVDRPRIRHVAKVQPLQKTKLPQIVPSLHRLERAESIHGGTALLSLCEKRIPPPAAAEPKELPPHRPSQAQRPPPPRLKMQRLTRRHQRLRHPQRWRIAVPAPGPPVRVRPNAGTGGGPAGRPEMGFPRLRGADVDLPDGKARGADRGDWCVHFRAAAGGARQPDRA